MSDSTTEGWIRKTLANAGALPLDQQQLKALSVGLDFANAAAINNAVSEICKAYGHAPHDGKNELVEILREHLTFWK